MAIIYFVSVLLLILAFILIKKTEKTLDIISFVGITIVTFLSLNVFICYVLTFLSIKQNLIILSLINVIISLPMILKIIKAKQIQKFKFDKVNLICVIVILIVTFIVSCLNFGIPFKIKYETGDPATHYYTSVVFAENEELLARNIDDVYGALRFRKIGSYANSGIIMECFSNVIDEIDYYHIFITFGIFVLFMTGYIMFCTLEKYTKTNTRKNTSSFCQFNICLRLSIK